MENNQNTTDRPDKNEGQSNNSQNTNQGSEQETTFDNPQEGKKWDNYQTRTLSTEFDENTAKQTAEDARTAFENDGKNNDSKD